MNAEAKRSAVPALIGGVVGLVLGTALLGGGASVASYFWVKMKESDARKGWNLVPVTVAMRDLAPGESMDFTDIAQRAVPEQFVTASVVLPDQAGYLVNREVQVPVANGEVLRHSFFSNQEGLNKFTDAEIIEACSAEVKSRGLVSNERTGADIRARLREPGGR